MKYSEQVLRGLAMSVKEREDCVRGLCADARFAGLAGTIAILKDQFSDAGSSQKMAEFHGCLAHAAGSRHALGVLEGMLKSCAETKRVRGAAVEAEGSQE